MRHARIDGNGVVDGLDASGQHQLPAGQGARDVMGEGRLGTDGPDDIALENPCKYGRQHHAQAQDDEGRQFPDNHHPRDDRHDQQPGRYVEMRLQGVRVDIDLRGGAVVGKAQDGKDYQGDDNGRHRGVKHVADVFEQGGPAHRRGQDGGVGQGGDLVAEIGA